MDFRIQPIQRKDVIDHAELSAAEGRSSRIPDSNFRILRVFMKSDLFEISKFLPSGITENIPLGWKEARLDYLLNYDRPPSRSQRSPSARCDNQEKGLQYRRLERKHERVLP